MVLIKKIECKIISKNNYDKYSQRLISIMYNKITHSFKFNNKKIQLDDKVYKSCIKAVRRQEK